MCVDDFGDRCSDGDRVDDGGGDTMVRASGIQS